MLTAAQARFIASDEAINHTPGSAVTAGDVVVLDSRLVCIARSDIPASEPGAVHQGGLYEVVKDNSDVSVGDRMYWDADGDPVGGTAGSGAFSSDPEVGPFAGYARSAAGTSVGTCDLLLRSAEAPGTPAGGWTITNFTEDKTFAGDSTTAADAVKAVASLVNDLIAAGILSGSVSA